MEGIAERKNKLETDNNNGNNDLKLWTGRTDSNKRVVFDDDSILNSLSKEEVIKFGSLVMNPFLSIQSSVRKLIFECQKERFATSYLPDRLDNIKKGQYVVVKVTSGRGHTLKGVVIASMTIRKASTLNLQSICTLIK